MDVSNGESKIWCYKEQYCIGTWNVRSIKQGKLEVVKQEMARVNINILGISSICHYIYYYGQENLRRIGVSLIVSKRQGLELTVAQIMTLVFTNMCLWPDSMATVVLADSQGPQSCLCAPSWLQPLLLALAHLTRCVCANPCFLHWQTDSLALSQKGSPNSVFEM